MIVMIGPDSCWLHSKKTHFVKKSCGESTTAPIEGRFAQLLPPQWPTAKGIELARAMLAAMGITEERLRGNAEQN
jgi:hypothetical protein